MAAFGIEHYQIKYTADGWTWIIITTEAAHDHYTTAAHWDSPMEAMADAVKFIEAHANELSKFEYDQEHILLALESSPSFTVPRDMLPAASYLRDRGKITLHLWRYSHGVEWIAETPLAKLNAKGR